MYDLVIIGGSAAGATASIYASRRGLKHLIIARDLGGEVATSGEIENWPGIIHTDGIELSGMFRRHVEKYTPEILEGYLATGIRKESEGRFIVTTDDGKEHEAKAVIVASGVHPKELGVPGEKEFRLKGVSYCTVCDGPLFKGKKVVTIGGGNSALESALMLADIAESVTVVNKNPVFKGDRVLMDNLAKKKNVTVIYGAMTTEIYGEQGGFAKGLKYKDNGGQTQDVPFDGAFVHIGTMPNSGFVPADVKKDEFGQIIVDVAGATSVPGIFAAGDVTHTPYNQIVIAAGQGCAAALSAVQYINRLPA